jgi:hypothetical protein
MKNQRKAWLAAGVLAVVAAGCFSDPVSDLQSGATALRLSKTYLVQNVNDSDVVSIQVLDNQGNPLPLTGVSFSSADPAVATMIPLPDSTVRTVPNGTQTRGTIIALTPGATTISVTANGLSQDIAVLSYPLAFDGVVTPATVAEGGLITIASTPVITFLPTVSATIGGEPALLVSSSATSLVVLAGVAGASQSLVISGMQLNGSIPLADLAALTKVTVTAGANATITTGPVVAIPAAVGGVTTTGGAVNFSSNVSDFFTITTGATADSVEIVVDWTAAAGTDYDVDMLLWDAAGTGLVSCAACTSANPERVRRRLVANTTYRIEVNMYDDHGNPVPKSYRLRVYKRA